MTPDQRRKAGQRLTAFEDWEARRIGIDGAVKASGLSRSRFYRLAADWRERRALDALGAFTGKGGSGAPLDADAVNSLQAVVAEVVRLNEGAKISQLVHALVARAGVPREKLPGATRLRGIVEEERRRVAASGEPGRMVRFDCSAVNLPRADGRPWIMFACLDVGTRLVLGAAIAAEADAALGYGAAATDATGRIGNGLRRLPWSPRLVEAQITAGQDVDASRSLVERLGSVVGTNLQMASAPKRYGRYFRGVVGDRMGRVELTPARTEGGSAMPDNGDMRPWSETEAMAAVAHGLDEHNSGVLAFIERGRQRRVPDDLERLLAELGGG